MNQTQRDTIPPPDEFLRPLLALAVEGEIRVKDAAEKVAAELGLSDVAKRQKRSNGEPIYVNRAWWARHALVGGQLAQSSRRGYIVATEKGRAFLGAHSSGFTRKQAYSAADVDESTAVDEGDGTDVPEVVVQVDETKISDVTPYELIDKATPEIEGALKAEMLAKIKVAPPNFLEKLVVDLLTKMGYGTTGEVLGGPGDEGIDGVIYQDALKLDRVYIQAKRHTERAIPPTYIQAFAGALGQQRADKGVFITTSSFSPQAKKAAEKADRSIVLIDGDRLAQLMLEYKVGCEVDRTISIKKIDEDYFDPDI